MPIQSHTTAQGQLKSISFPAKQFLPSLLVFVFLCQAAVLSLGLHHPNTLGHILKDLNLYLVERSFN